MCSGLTTSLLRQFSHQKLLHAIEQLKVSVVEQKNDTHDIVDSLSS